MSHLTPEQAAIIKPALLADPALAQWIIDYRDDLIRDYYNEAASPAFYLWRNLVTLDEIQNDDAYNWTVVDNLSTGSKFRIWEWLFANPGRSINASKANVRAGIVATWVGNAQLVAVQTMILAKCKRLATVAEKLLADTSNGGTGALVTPAKVSVDVLLDTSDVSAMLSGER